MSDIMLVAIFLPLLKRRVLSFLILSCGAPLSLQLLLSFFGLREVSFVKIGLVEFSQSIYQSLLTMLLLNANMLYTLLDRMLSPRDQILHFLLHWPSASLYCLPVSSNWSYQRQHSRLGYYVVRRTRFL